VENIEVGVQLNVAPVHPFTGNAVFVNIEPKQPVTLQFSADALDLVESWKLFRFACHIRPEGKQCTPKPVAEVFLWRIAVIYADLLFRPGHFTFVTWHFLSLPMGRPENYIDYVFI
jgi:hypothetical protein